MNSPEFKKANFEMRIDEFKKIYYMEWGHRMSGRVTGIVFVLPFASFFAAVL